MKKNIAVPLQKGTSYFTLVGKRNKYPKESGKFIKSSKKNSEAKTPEVSMNIFPKEHRKYS